MFYLFILSLVGYAYGQSCPGYTFLTLDANTSCDCNQLLFETAYRGGIPPRKIQDPDLFGVSFSGTICEGCYFEPDNDFEEKLQLNTFFEYDKVCTGDKIQMSFVANTTVDMATELPFNVVNEEGDICSTSSAVSAPKPAPTPKAAPAPEPVSTPETALAPKPVPTPEVAPAPEPVPTPEAAPAPGIAPAPQSSRRTVPFMAMVLGILLILFVKYSSAQTVFVYRVTNATCSSASAPAPAL